MSLLIAGLIKKTRASGVVAKLPHHGAIVTTLDFIFVVSQLAPTQEIELL
jgi:hypothetical protein